MSGASTRALQQEGVADVVYVTAEPMQKPLNIVKLGEGLP